MAEQPALVEQGHWHAMFLSGMRPTEVFDTILVEAMAAKREVHFIDPTSDALQQFMECAPHHCLGHAWLVHVVLGSTSAAPCPFCSMITSHKFYKAPKRQ